MRLNNDRDLSVAIEKRKAELEVEARKTATSKPDENGEKEGGGV